jgi:hypothetical protein
MARHLAIMNELELAHVFLVLAAGFLVVSVAVLVLALIYLWRASTYLDSVKNVPWPQVKRDGNGKRIHERL